MLIYKYHVDHEGHKQTEVVRKKRQPRSGRSCMETHITGEKNEGVKCLKPKGLKILKYWKTDLKNTHTT